jgi:hypothetical protein
MEGLLEKSGFSTHLSDSLHRQTWMFSSLRTAGPELALEENKGHCEGSTEASTEGESDGYAKDLPLDVGCSVGFLGVPAAPCSIVGE